jgi:hypothetical protein
MTDLKDKVNFLEKLLTTLTDTYGQSHHRLGFDEDLSAPSSLPSVH